MRTLIYNGRIITGDGKSILENRLLVLNDQFIDGIGHVPRPSYDRAARIIDAKGGFIIPGLINHHTHQITVSPGPADYDLPPLPETRVKQNLKTHLLQGTTTVVSLDGFNTMDEVREARNWTPMSLQTMSLHLPLHFKDARLITLGGLNDKHYNTTLESMIEQGALGIGEAGPLGIGKKGEELDINYVDFLYLPFLAREKTRVQLSRQEAMALKAVLFAVPLDRKALSELVKQLNIKSALDSLISLVEHYGEHQQLAIDKCIEAAQAAKELDVPLCLHNSPDTRPLVLEVAERLNQRLIAAHCNFGYKPQEACEVARAIKKSGGWVDILGGDYFGIRSYFPNHATTFALVAEGLVDLISTDYIGGYWDSILQVLRYFVEQNMLNLPDAISLATGNVCKAIPHIAPDRGLISEGKIADLAILSPDDIAKVTTVIIGGRVVVNEGRMVAPSEGEEC